MAEAPFEFREMANHTLLPSASVGADHRPLDDAEHSTVSLERPLTRGPATRAGRDSHARAAGICSAQKALQPLGNDDGAFGDDPLGAVLHPLSLAAGDAAQRDASGVAIFGRLNHQDDGLLEPRLTLRN